MPYNLRSEESLKRPGDQVLVCQPKRPRKKHLSTRHQSELETILNKEVLRPLTLFESLFAAYPIVQSIVQYLSTPDVIVLSITTPVLRRFLKENSAFRVFSNYRDVMATEGPARYYEYENLHLYTYKSFASNLYMSKLLDEYINPGGITSLVLDGTDVNFPAIARVCFLANNLSLLSLKFCRRIGMFCVSMLLDGRKEMTRFPCGSGGGVEGNPSTALRTFLPMVKTLRVWGTSGSQWQYVPSVITSTTASSEVDQIYLHKIAHVIKICNSRNITLDVMPCGSALQCVGLDICNEEYLCRRHEGCFDFDRHPISYSSIWMAEKKGGKCKFCAKVVDFKVCEECTGEPGSIYGFCMTCDLFVCDSPECEGMRTDCFDCGMQCRECIAKIGPECGACANTVCVKHLSERDSESISCDHCSAIFCDHCINYLHGQMHHCVVCNDAICVRCLSPRYACGRCKKRVCLDCAKAHGDAAFTPNARETYLRYDVLNTSGMVSGRGWFCVECLSRLTTRLKLRSSDCERIVMV